MSAGKILWGQISLVFGLILAGVWGATQWTAWRLAYQPALGAPWFEVLGHSVYAPPSLFVWWFVYDAYRQIEYLINEGLRLFDKGNGQAPDVVGAILAAAKA